MEESLESVATVFECKISWWNEMLGLTPDEIVSRYPQLTLAQVHAALAYYFDHTTEIRTAIREGQEFADQLRASTPSKLSQKIIGRDADGDTLSS